MLYNPILSLVLFFLFLCLSIGQYEMFTMMERTGGLARGSVTSETFNLVYLLCTVVCLIVICLFNPFKLSAVSKILPLIYLVPFMAWAACLVWAYRAA